MHTTQCYISSIIVLLATINVAYPQGHLPSLRNVVPTSGFVVPTFVSNGTKKILLGRESGGNDKGMYDAFGGTANPGESALSVAARECAEELITHITMKKNSRGIKSIINLGKSNTEYVLVRERGVKASVTYISCFDRYIPRIRNTFYSALQHATRGVNKEKDRIAFIEWKTLKKAIRATPKKARVNVLAQVIDPRTKNLILTTITLRPIFVLNMRGLLEGTPYTPGKEPNVRFY